MFIALSVPSVPILSPLSFTQAAQEHLIRFVLNLIQNVLNGTAGVLFELDRLNNRQSSCMVLGYDCVPAFGDSGPLGAR